MRNVFGLMIMAAAVAALAGCGGHGSKGGGDQGGSGEARSDGGSGDASALSGPPTINPLFGARDPRKCAKVTHKPSEAEAAAMSQCAKENGGNEMLILWQNLKVQMGNSRPYAYNSDSHYNSIDTTAAMYPIRATGDMYACGRESTTCMVQHVTDSEGACYKTTFGDWDCWFSGLDTIDPNKVEMPHPTTY
jgi:hypothetical protein